MWATASVDQDRGSRLVQGTNDIGGRYGEVPSYGDGAEYGYGHGYEYGGAARTATSPWDPSPWDSPHGDVLTVPFPEFDPLGPPATDTEPDASASESGRPVFFESPGRRHRRPRSLLRATRLLVIPAGGYVALLISAMLGGPGISSSFAPQPDSTHPGTPRATAPDSAPGTGPSAGSPSSAKAQQDSRPGAPKPPGTTEGSTSPTAPAVPSGPTVGSASPTAPATTSEPTAEPTRTTSPTPTATLTPSARGRALGSSHKPVK
ncbi:hypothetical protein ABZ027_36050 [Streptomyces sp. NPDC006332]|uniref:hypothetical protein n=1 Tax=Streptomyces sp. NPDC006332 TaxID=3155456 RepID=UPI0033B4BAAB